MKYLYYLNDNGYGLVVRETSGLNLHSTSLETFGMEFTSGDYSVTGVSDSWCTSSGVDYLEETIRTFALFTTDKYMFTSKHIEKIAVVSGGDISFIDSKDKYFTHVSGFADYEVDLKRVRGDRNNMLLNSDWTVLSDSPLTSGDQDDYKDWRQYLRDRPQDMSKSDGEVWDFDTWLANQ